MVRSSLAVVWVNILFPCCGYFLSFEGLIRVCFARVVFLFLY
jgi:hypothetical protein